MTLRLAAGEALLLERDGTLGPGDALAPGGAFEDLIAVDLAAGRVQVRASSPDRFDLALRVIGPDDAVVVGEGAAADGIVAAFTVRVPGLYRLYVGGQHDGAAGVYRLSVHGAAAATAAAGDRDQVRLAGGQGLVGRLAGGPLAVRGALGVVTLPLDRLAGLRRESDGAVVVGLSDGGRLHGVLVGEALRLRVADGAELTIPLTEIATVQRATAPPPVHDGPWLVLGSNRVRARWTAGTLTSDGHFGELAIPVSALAAIEPGAPAHPLGLIRLRDGGRLAGRCPDLPLALIDSTAAPPAGAGVEVMVPAPPPAFALTLSTGDVVVGQPQRLVLASALGEFAVPAGGLVALTCQNDLPELWTVSLSAGGRAFGRLAGDVLTVTTSWHPALAVPRALVRGGGRIGDAAEGAKGATGAGAKEPKDAKQQGE